MNALAKLREHGHSVRLQTDGGILINSPPPSAWIPRLRALKPDIVAALMSEQLSPADESRVRAWLTHIEETDQDFIDGVLDQCRGDPEALVYFLKRSTEVPQQRLGAIGSSDEY